MFDVSPRGRYALTVCWALVILGGSLAEGGGGALPPAGPLGVVGADKWVHAAEYGLLAWLLAWAVRPGTRRAVVRTFVAVVGYGVVVELLQVPLATRSGDPVDAVANAVGVTLGLLLWRAVVGLATGDPAPVTDE